MGFVGVNVTNVSRYVVVTLACLQIMDLWLECSIGTIVRGTLLGIMSDLPTIETGIAA